MKKRQPKTKQISGNKHTEDTVIYFHDSSDRTENILYEEKQAVLRTRALSLATEEDNKENNRDYIEIVEFNLSFEKYGIETKYIREVCSLKNYTALPGLPAFVFGITNIRGQILSIIDLKKFFNLPEKGLGELNKIIIVKNEQMEFGILADTIQGTGLLPVDTIRASLPGTSDIGSEYLKGITEEHLIVLDAKKILEDKRIIINQEKV